MVAATQQVNNAKLKQQPQLNNVEEDPTMAQSTTSNALRNDSDDENETTTKTAENRRPGPSANSTTIHEKLLSKNEELSARTKLLSVDETAPPADPLTT